MFQVYVELFARPMLQTLEPDNLLSAELSTNNIHKYRVGVPCRKLKVVKSCS